MDTTEPQPKGEKRLSLRLPVIGTVMLAIGSLLMLFGLDDFSERENNINKSPGVFRTASEVALTSAQQKREDKEERERRREASIVRATEIRQDFLLASATPPEVDLPHQPELVSLGEYKITFYCKCAKCCGKSDGITATGTIAASNRTIAVDPKVIPFGSKVVIDGREYIAEDTGGFKGQTIDMFVDSHQEALSRGVVRKEVYMIRESKAP